MRGCCSAPHLLSKRLHWEKADRMHSTQWHSASALQLLLGCAGSTCIAVRLHLTHC